MQGCDFWLAWRVLDQPVALVFEGEHQMLIQVAPIFEEDSLVLLVIALEHQLLLNRTEEEEFELLRAKRWLVT